MRPFRQWLRLWFTFDYPVGRRDYLVSGLALAAVKYAGDVALVYGATGRVWRPTDYFSPLTSFFEVKLLTAPAAFLPVLGLWALPFLWIGVSMSMRRALDAGRSAWLALLFFVPAFNYLFMGTMCVLPSRPDVGAAHAAAAAPPRRYEHRLPKALLAIAAGVAIGLAMLAVTVYFAKDYGVALFLGTPFLIGLITAFLFNRRYPASDRETQQVVMMTLGIIGGVLLLTALEGALCLLMAAPLAAGIAAMGGVFGRDIALRDRSAPRYALLGVVLLPAGALLGAGRPAATPLREVRSSVVIDAPADVVWRRVIAFPPLPPPNELAFRAGIAYPQRAEIVGVGVGAVRRCVFSTGAFVEPITRWEPGRRLSFDVTEQPRPLEEWSPYASIAPPHLDGYFRSRRGEFRLVALADGRTRLEGSTWYEMRLGPEAYWVLFGDALIGRIHHRVLDHIRAVAEADVERSGSRPLTTSVLGGRASRW